MTKNEIAPLRALFNEKLNEYSDALFNTFLDYLEEESYVVLTEEILDTLDKWYPDDDFKENYTYAIGETVYIGTVNGDSLLSLLKSYKTDSEEKLPSVEFYTLFDIEETLKSVSDAKGFLGVMDSYTHIKYENFYDIFIYSMLKLKNK